MSRFQLPYSAGLSDSEKIGHFLLSRLGSGYRVDHQDEKLLQPRAGRRGEFGRWLNTTVCGDFSVIVSSNPLVGTAVRFYQQGGRTLLLVRGVIPHQRLRETILPYLGLAAMLGSLIVLQNVLGMVIFFGFLPVYLGLPRLLALPLTLRISNLLSDSDACRAVGINLTIADRGAISADAAGSAGAWGISKIGLGIVVAIGSVIFAYSELDHRPYTGMLWEDTLVGSSLVTGIGLTLILAGASNLYLRRLSWLQNGVYAIILTGLTAGAWAIVAPQVCPPAKKFSTTTISPTPLRPATSSETINK